MVAIAPRPESAYQRLLVRTIGLELEQKRQDEETVPSIVEVLVPDEFHGKTVTELELRNR